MREAIEQYVEREEKREQLRNDALSAWTNYQNTGLHVTAEEADNWLAKLEAGSKPAKTPLLLNVTTEMDLSGTAGCRPSA